MTPEESIASLQRELQEANENLQTQCRLNSQITLRLANLIYWNNRLGNDLAAICEAYLAGDTETVLNGIGRFATAYQQNNKPVERRVH
ncbi:hypothetical protein CDR19_25450 [Ectopseudomonas toyotomiensis]|uniref:Uncharacterized protein n=1 Tax=Ectopseudomonas toyotomiensis TaxID=554344 RepID=A0A1I5M2P0_9GAMM|nr:hypothetical protein [Pseudomonas toyotomiensis]PIA66162.1 hypothetical protein CDR19_25450 [Pseudomonas toyotomiensis]SFP03908.1 hypothetical protein SAMN05216177_1013 [Pseudomonas toyotomiensis]SFP97542.1 hypothetical protein SAMN05216177_106373 [Pseudomonas toyotomiensis]